MGPIDNMSDPRGVTCLFFVCRTLNPLCLLLGTSLRSRGVNPSLPETPFAFWCHGLDQYSCTVVSIIVNKSQSTNFCSTHVITHAFDTEDHMVQRKNPTHRESNPRRLLNCGGI